MSNVCCLQNVLNNRYGQTVRYNVYLNKSLSFFNCLGKVLLALHAIVLYIHCIKPRIVKHMTLWNFFDKPFTC